MQVFNETRVPDMPRVRTAEEWQTTAAAIRKQVLDQVVFRGGAAEWRIPRCRLNGARRLKICPDTASETKIRGSAGLVDSGAVVRAAGVWESAGGAKCQWTRAHGQGDGLQAAPLH